VFIALAVNIFAQGIQESRVQLNQENAQAGVLPLKKVVILTSGLAYYEHSGSLATGSSITIPFRPDAVNDALKTLVINDPSSANPSVRYQSEQTLYQTLRSLKIDLSDSPGFAAILSRLRGAEIEITTSSTHTGRITGIEYRGDPPEPWILINTVQGLKSFSLSEISSVKFTDKTIEQDLNRALDLLASSRNADSRDLIVNLPGSGRRDVTISYVIPSPVWKVSYRLDLGAAKPLFQGWAIVDNDSDNDWNNVTLSLVTGRPSSFIQNLYPPYYVSRPVLPLSIAGTAAAASHDQGFGMSSRASVESYETEKTAADSMMMLRAPSPAVSSSNLAGGVVQTAEAAAAGGQFEFTIKNPVSLDRRMSAMLPLVEVVIDARKLLIYSGGNHPRLGAEITNTSKMKLPAGPVTVYDGVYSGDALLEFWNEDEKRLISFGEDLSVTALTGSTNTNIVSAVTVAAGVMTITRDISYIKNYTFKNSGSGSKLLVVEHAKISQAELVSPKASEQTSSHYRFELALPANKETSLSVNEKRPVSERITLLSLRQDAFLSYSGNQEIPSNVRRALERAVELRKEVDTADTAVKNIDADRIKLISDQDRIRRNLEAAGSQTQQGQEYLRRLVSMDGEIDNISKALAKANADLITARANYENYINSLNLR